MTPSDNAREVDVERKGSRWDWVFWPILWSFLLSMAYHYGYHRGRTAGALDMKCAIFGVVDRLSDGAPDAEKYALTRLGCRAALRQSGEG